VPAPFNRLISSLTLNPTEVNPKLVNTTIATYSFKLLDRGGLVTQLVNGLGESLLGQPVEIWLGRSFVGMDFSDYFKLPVTKIRKLDSVDNYYAVTTTEETDRMNRQIYNAFTPLGVSILASTTVITAKSDLAAFPSSGVIKIEDEYITYAGIDLVNKRFTGCTRGFLATEPAAHAINSDVYLAEKIEGNPLTLLLQLLVSPGGGGPYDVLKDGCGISQSLIDVAEIEDLRDSKFSGMEFRLVPSDVDIALKYIEAELLAPCNCRFTYSDNSKLTLSQLDQAEFIEERAIVDHDTLSKIPAWSVDTNNIANRIEISWDYDEITNNYRQNSVYQDDASIATYGLKTALTFSFAGVREDLDGQAIVDNFANRLLARVSVPSPEISITTHVDKSMNNSGSNMRLDTTTIPAQGGTLHFADDLEIVARSINFLTGDVTFKLAFASFTGQRSCYIAPSDSLVGSAAPNQIEVAAGRGDAYSIGWAMRLWDNDAQDYTSDPVNTILSITDDVITFVDDWATLSGGPENVRLKFADYDDCTDDQKRYCFISAGETVFNDGKQTYRIS
jgi:hypothetical protein